MDTTKTNTEWTPVTINVRYVQRHHEHIMPVNAHALGNTGLAVHRSVVQGKHGKNFTVTHVASGWAVAMVASEREARNTARVVAGTAPAEWLHSPDAGGTNAYRLAFAKELSAIVNAARWGAYK